MARDQPRAPRCLPRDRCALSVRAAPQRAGGCRTGHRNRGPAGHGIWSGGALTLAGDSRGRYVPIRGGGGVSVSDAHAMNTLDLPGAVVDYLSSLFHERKRRFAERQLRRILRLPTEAEPKAREARAAADKPVGQASQLVFGTEIGSETQRGYRITAKRRGSLCSPRDTSVCCPRRAAVRMRPAAPPC